MPKNNQSKTISWGATTQDGSEVWDTNPVFTRDEVAWKDCVKLLFFPKKFFLYRCIYKHIQSIQRRYATIEGGEKYTPRILDVGCGTGSTVIDFKKMFGRTAEVVGVDVVGIQIDLAKEKIKKYAVWADVQLYDGRTLPFDDSSFDAIYTSDVLGHVEDVRFWLDELNRILKPNGILAMFSESKLGKHAFLRNYLMKRGINVDPHAHAHISLYSKTTLKELLHQAGFTITKMRSGVWAHFFVYPEEVYNALKGKKGFLFLKILSGLFAFIKKKTHPVCAAIGELYSLLEMMTLGRFVESQGFVVLGRKSIKN